MKLEISREAAADLLARASASPEEICGLLLGRDGRVEQVRPCANLAENPARNFEIDPAALFQAHREARRGGPEILGHYHSHPTGKPKPSATDAAMALGDGAIWLIVGEGKMRAWHSGEAGAFQEIPIRHPSSRP